MTLNKILNEREREQLVSFNNNESLKNAVKKVLLYNIYGSEVMQPGELLEKETSWIYALPNENVKATDEEIGKMVRIRVSALTFLEDAFKALEAYQPEVVTEEEVNPGV